jgi:hypothetical protein
LDYLVYLRSIHFACQLRSPPINTTMMHLTIGKVAAK